MNEFIQMDIFFFISSLFFIVCIIFATVIGIYVVLCIKKINAIISDLKYLVSYSTDQSLDSLDMIKDKIESVLDNVGWVEKAIIAGVGTILAKTIKTHVKIKREVRKSKK